MDETTEQASLLMFYLLTALGAPEPAAGGSLTVVDYQPAAGRSPVGHLYEEFLHVGGYPSGLTQFRVFAEREKIGCKTCHGG